MKTLKFILPALLFVSLVFSVSAQSELSMGKSSKMVMDDLCFYCPCANDGAGEMLCGKVLFHVVMNGNKIHWNVIGTKLTGSITGAKYTLSNVNNYDMESGEVHFTVRTKGPGGLTTFITVVGKAELDWNSYGAHPLEGGSMFFMCR